ncbi:MAG: hypothetical protein ACLQU9_14500, partial [Acidimicrobiales bacterium]
MRRRRFADDGATQGGPIPGHRRRSEAGDTLIEILITLTVIGIGATAILLAFATSISGSGQERTAASFDTMLRTAAAEVTSDIQQQYSQAQTNPTGPVGLAVAQCAGANLVNQASIPLPDATYTATITDVQFWQTNLPSFAFTAAQPPSSYSACPSGTNQQGPQQLTIQVSGGGRTESITTVVQDPNAPPGGTTCVPALPASKLVWVDQPGNGNAASVLYPSPTIALEDANNCVVQTDASSVVLAITPPTNGATLSNCVPNVGYGETTFQNCNIATPGTYTLQVTDPTDNITTPVVSGSFKIAAGVATQLKFVSPGGQPVNGTGGTPFATVAHPVEVQIEDSAGNPVLSDNTAVTLAIGTNPSGDGSLSGCSTGTTVNGLATFTGCKIDKIGTGYTLTATDAADNLTVPSAPSNPFNITVGPPAQLSFTTSPGTTVAGDPFGPQPVVAIQDLGGNQTTATSTVSLAIGPGSPAGNLSGCTSTTTSGVATFSGCKINNPGNGYTLVASDGTLTPGTSNQFNIVTAALTSLKVVPATNTPTAGTAFNVTITELDQSGFPFPGPPNGNQTITFSGPSNSPNGTTPLYTNPVNFSGGIGTTSITLYDAQTTTLTAQLGSSVTGTSGNITVSPLTTPVSFTVANPGTQTAGIQFSETITAADQYGNAASGYTGNHTLTFTGPSNAPNGKPPSYPAQVNFAAGVGTANITLYAAQASTTLRATATGPSLTGTSTAFTVNPGAPGSFSVTNPGTQTAGTPFSVTITATDSYGNAAGNYTGPQTLSFTGPSNSPNGTQPVYPVSVNFTNGVGTASGITLYDAQTTSLTVGQNGANGNSGNFTVNGTGAIGAFVLSNIGTQTAGTAFNVTITATDQYGNAATGYANGNHTLTFTGPSNSPNGHVPTYPAQVNFTNGVGTANITLYDAQTTTLTASATGPSLTGTSNSFTVNGKAATAYSVTNPGTQTAGTPFTLTITAVDAYGNTDTGYNPGFSNINFSGPASSPNGTAPTYQGSGFFGTYPFTNGVATATVTLYDVQTTTITASQGGLSGTSTSFAVNGAAPATFNVSNPGAQVVGTPFSVGITAVDAYGNTATGYTGPQTLAFSGPANSPNGHVPTYPASVTFTNGAGTASPITLYDVQASTSLTVTQGSVTGNSGNFAVTGSGAATAYAVANPGTQTAGTAFSVTLTATDAYGNTATGYGGAKAITFSGPANSPNGHVPTYPASVTFTNGVGTASGITLYDAQSTTLTATLGSVTGTSTSFTVNGAATAASLNVTNPGGQVAGTSFGLGITAIDAYGNTATG